MGVPMAPQATGAVLAMRFRTADWKGLNPSPTITAPAIATGVPKPEVPSMMAPKEKAIRRTWRRRSKEMWMMDSLTISNLPVIRVMLYRNMAPMMIQMIPRNPDRLPRTNAENAVATGIPKGMQDTRNAAM